MSVSGEQVVTGATGGAATIREVAPIHGPYLAHTWWHPLTSLLAAGTSQVPPLLDEVSQSGVTDDMHDGPALFSASLPSPKS